MIVPEASAQVYSDGAMGGNSPEGLSAGGRERPSDSVADPGESGQGTSRPQAACLSQSDGQVGMPICQSAQLLAVLPTRCVGTVSDTRGHQGHRQSVCLSLMVELGYPTIGVLTCRQSHPPGVWRR